MRGGRQATGPVFVALFVGACGGDDGQEASVRCEAVPQQLASQIESGLTVQGGGTLREAKAVESEDFEDTVYFISADIRGPGMEGSDQIGTWATDSLEGHVPLFSVDAIAKEFSEWPDASSTEAGFSLADDGAEESRDCVQAS